MTTLLSELSFDFYLGFSVNKADWVHVQSQIGIKRLTLNIFRFVQF